jgi:hypothetical protein
MRVVEGIQSCPAPKQVSRRNAPDGAEEPSTTRFRAVELKATNRPSALIEGESLAPLASSPPDASETREVEGVQPAGAPMHVSRIKISATPLVSLETRLLASDRKTTSRPSALTAG